MKKIIMLNGSPRGKNASSQKILDWLKALLPETFSIEKLSYASIYRNQNKINELFKAISECDAIILAFPLYVDCTPAITQDFLEGYSKYLLENPSTTVKKLYTIINCGFPEAEHCRVAFDIIHCFSKQTDFNPRYNLSIGMGHMVGQLPIEASPVKHILTHLKAIIEDLKGESIDFITKVELFEPTFGFMNFIKKRLYIFAGSYSWKQQAKKNNVKHLMHSKPYLK